MRTLNLGIVAHVDAGKTTLTERLLYAAGVIDEVGSVDAGTTQTDFLELERQRGITIKAAVVSFAVGDVTVNLIDTPGHPDFIAEVERVLGVLDGAVLVISAVEGVQPQTRALMRALQRLRVPTVIFVNKIDRRGAGYDEVLKTIAERLTPDVVPMGSVRGLGTRAAVFTPSGEADTAFLETLAEALAERNDSVLAEYVRGGPLPYRALLGELATQTRRAAVYPVFFGSALTGAGVEAIQAGAAELLTPAERDLDGPVAGLVFKVDRTAGGEKMAYAAIFSGALRARHGVTFGGGGRPRKGKVTGIEVFQSGQAVKRGAVLAGQIGRLTGLADVRIGDAIGTVPDRFVHDEFAPPAFEALIAPVRPRDGARLRVALRQLEEQDPLIRLRQDPLGQAFLVSLYGDVQKEVIQATLAADYGLDVVFRETTTVYIERPAGTGSHIEFLQAVTHPFSATVGLRIEPAPAGSGVQLRVAVNPNLVPLYIYKSSGKFAEAMARYTDQALQQGLYGWRVTDCLVTMTDCGYYVGDGPAKPVGTTALTTAAHFRRLTPMVVAKALERAGTTVCEPMVR
ncbi:MAG TPA: GTP-binding protein, partial [Acidimicrobiales bacterium]|nr:GTP-binding protein [Acidimicrobiales bacterium]